jgi:hypothetical protein
VSVFADHTKYWLALFAWIHYGVMRYCCCVASGHQRPGASSELCAFRFRKPDMIQKTHHLSIVNIARVWKIGETLLILTNVNWSYTKAFSFYNRCWIVSRDGFTIVYITPILIKSKWRNPLSPIQITFNTLRNIFIKTMEQSSFSPQQQKYERSFSKKWILVDPLWD